jgi:hypothetical protein
MTSSLPESFEFSQSSLQDYIDCHRRFQLRYIERLAWPAIQAEPARENEQLMQRGERFHRLAQQYLLGLPPEKLARMAGAGQDENLLRWWENFTTSSPAQLPGEKYAEVSLAVPLGGFRLKAVYDLVLFETGGKVIIFDWKTGMRRPKPAWLRERLQTRVYPYLLVEAGSVLNHRLPLAPEQVEMIYWFAEPGLEPERILYSAEQRESDRLFLLGLVEGLCTLPSDQYPLAADESACRFCVYRSLCNRGIQAGSREASQGEIEYDAERPDPLDFNLEQISEVGF